MRRIFKKNYIIFAVTAFVLVLAIPVSAIRINLAKKQMTPTAVAEFTGNFGTVTDRYSEPIYDGGKLTDSAIFERIIGGYDSVQNKYTISNSIVSRYEQELINTKFKKGADFSETEKEAGVITTTLLPSSVMQKVVDIYGDNSGSVTVYNYKTGEILALLSVNGSEYFSENLGLVTPGSTMKAITSVCACEQGLDLSKYTFTCNGAYTLADGNTVKCHGNHGTIGYEDAFRFSCNSWFAQCISNFKTDETIDVMSKLGFYVNKNGEKERTVDRLTVSNSEITYTTNATFANTWGLIGQVNSNVNPLQMLQIFGAVANEGKSAQPYLISSILSKNNNEKVEYESGKAEYTEYMSKKTAKYLKSAWTNATKAGYGLKLDDRIIISKTGTAQQTVQTDTGEKTQINRLLIGATDDSVAFFINISDTDSADERCFQIANLLISYIQ